MRIYDPYTDSYKEVFMSSPTVVPPAYTVQLTELTDECIDKIAERVVQKIREKLGGKP